MNAEGDLMYTKPKGPSVTLATNDGKELVLPLNKPVNFPGLLTKFVNTDTIAIQVARDNGVINDGENLCTVTSLTSNEVILAYGTASKIYKPMTKAEKDTLLANIKENRSANMGKAIATYKKMKAAPEVQLSEGYQEYRDFIFEQTKEQANQQPMDVQEFNTRRNDAKRKMAKEHGGVTKAEPIDTKYSTSDSDYDKVKHEIKEEEKKNLNE
jgi:hypothetical protein